MVFSGSSTNKTDHHDIAEIVFVKHHQTSKFNICPFNELKRKNDNLLTNKIFDLALS